MAAVLAAVVFLSLCLTTSTYEVATLCATALNADKLICLLDGPVVDNQGRLIRWMTLQQADLLIRERASVSQTASDYVKAVAGAEYAKSIGLRQSVPEASPGGSTRGAIRANGTELWLDEVGRDEANGGATAGLPEEEDDAAASLARWNAQRALYSMSFEKPKPLPTLSGTRARGSRSGSGYGSANGNGNGRRGLAVGGWSGRAVLLGTFVN